MIRFKRIHTILQSSVSNLITPVISVLFSYFIIKKYNADLWGGFVYYLIIVNLAAHILGWGNKEYLLREFSRNSFNWSKIWLQCFITRIVFIPLVFIPYYFLSGNPEELVLMAVLTFLIFINQSFDVIIAFERKFMLIVYAEIISFFILALMLFSKGASGKENLLALYIYSFIFKPFFLFIYFRKNFLKKNIFRELINIKFFKYAFPFFLLGLTGMIQSRFDLYCISYFLNKDSLGKYQVIANFLDVFQSASVFMVAPYVKDIYRLKRESIMKMKRNVFLSGLALIIPFMFVLYIAIVFIYNFNFTVDYYIFSAIYILPVYYYIVPVYEHYKFGKQNNVILITAIGIMSGLILNIYLIPVMGIRGALLSSGISQLIMCGSYYISVIKINNKEHGVIV